MKYISRTVIILSLVSFFTDTASEMLYPIIPIYLKSIGFSIALIGLLEGFAEATAGISKGYFGKLSDNYAKRLPFVQVGYALSAISKPMFAIFVYPIWIFFARTLDRFGKGIRTGARDAILSDEAKEGNKARVFGFHRSMDTFGAVVGPLFALIYLFYFPQDYKTLFLIAFVPGCLATLSTFLIKENKSISKQKKNSTSFFYIFKYWKTSPHKYKMLCLGLLGFAIFNSSDVFLLLKVKQAGYDDVYLIGIYIFYNLVYAIFSYPLGIIADKIGLKKMFVFGLMLFSIVYFLMSINNEIFVFAIVFFLYGIFSAATEGISKAWISNIVPQSDIATAIGSYAGFQSICALIASSFAGLLWYQFGATTTFIITSIASFIVLLFFVFKIKY